ncbi:MAG: hypothetical protein ACETWR_21300 [Anaerolineae bacterium]
MENVNWRTIWSWSERWLTWLAWALFALILGAFAVFPDEMPGWIQFLAVLLSWACTIWFAIRYRRFFGRWRGLLTVIGVLALARWWSAWHSAAWVEPTSLPYRLNAVALVLSLDAVIAIAASMIAMLCYRDVSVTFIGLGIPALFLSMWLAGAVYGDFARFQTLYKADTQGRFWLWETLSMAIPCLCISGGLAFVPHYLVLIIRELREY